MLKNSKNQEAPDRNANLISILSSFITAIFPCVYLIIRNYSKLGSNDFLISLGAASVHWLLVFVISFVLMKSANKAALATIVAVIPLSIFHSIQNGINSVIPSFYYWHGVILVITICSIAWIIVHRHISQSAVAKLNSLIGAIFLILIIVNAATSSINYFRQRDSLNQDLAAVKPASENKILGSEDLPNIYLFIFDEYSGPEALLRYTGYDNHEFHDELTELGFNISKTSRNYTISTTVEIPNLLNLTLLVNDKNNTEATKDEVLKNPFLFSILRDFGYDLNLLDDQDFISTPEQFFQYSFVPQGVFSREESLLTLLVDKSIYYPLRQKPSQARIVEVNEMFDYGAKSSLIQESNLFTLGYLMFPHLPWVVDEYGNETAASMRHDWQNSDVYLGQLKYSNKLIIDMVEKIIGNDPNSCIILMSDHAYRQPFHLLELYGTTIADPALESKYMRNILNAVYIGGDKLQIEGMSGINTLRIVLDKILSTNLGLIEESK